MAASSLFIQNLVAYGEESAKNKARLIMWRDKALEDVGDNVGGSVGSAGANGASMSLRPDGMNNADWFDCLSEALRRINKGVNYTGRSYGQF